MKISNILHYKEHIMLLTMCLYVFVFVLMFMTYCMVYSLKRDRDWGRCMLEAIFVN